LKDRGKTARELYERLRKDAKYASLPAWSNLAQTPESLKEWEKANPNQCTRARDDGQFFGFEKVAQGYLGRFTKFLFIPAVREAAADAAEGKNSVFGALMDLVVRSILAKKQELTDLRQNTQRLYETILAPSNLRELEMLSKTVTQTLKTYVPNASVEMEWLPLAELDIPLPKADVKLVEDGYASPVSKTGHGLQRAFILTMSQHLALAQNMAAQTAASVTVVENTGSMAAPVASSALEEKLPNLVLAIEEPELFQHPNRQRHLSRIFQTLASGSTPGVAKNTQVLLATHSPLFIRIDRTSQIRLLRKHLQAEKKPKVTRVVSTDLNLVAKKVWEADGSRRAMFNEVTMLARLQSLMTPWMSEGFFADVAVLVEGEDDRAAILGVAKALGHELESEGCSIIPCGGKTNLDRPTIIFRELGIPVFVIWDGDKGDKDADPQQNHMMLRLTGQELTDWPSTCICRESARFESALEDTLREEIGVDVFEKVLAASQLERGIPKRKHAIKNPVIIADIISEAAKLGKTSKTLEQIVTSILTLRRGVTEKIDELDQVS
jgi:putative ATP-dependent endonuclease of the OLD family